MRLTLPAAVFGALLVITAPLPAHHSFAAEYDANKPVKLTGTVTKFDMTNPHSWIHMDVQGADGKTANWAFETASPNTLFRRGFKKDFLKPGTVITIEGYLAKDGSNTGNAHRVTLPDGNKIILGTEENPG